MVKLKVAQDTDTEKVWVSNSINHGDWPFRFVLKVRYLEEWMPEDEVKDLGKYSIEICAASLRASRRQREQAVSYTPEEWKELDTDIKYAELVESGVAATLYSNCGNNLRKLLKDARQELKWIGGIGFGFAMDRAGNGLGANGWDFIQGHCYPKELRRRRARAKREWAKRSQA